MHRTKIRIIFLKLQDILRKHEMQKICVIGEYNAIFDKELDRKSTKTREKIKTNLLKTFLRINRRV